MALAWKAGWEQSLKGSNPLSSARLNLFKQNEVAAKFETTEDIYACTSFLGCTFGKSDMPPELLILTKSFSEKY
jgi:hypothetical protein